MKKGEGGGKRFIQVFSLLLKKMSRIRIRGGNKRKGRRSVLMFYANGPNGFILTVTDNVPHSPGSQPQYIWAAQLNHVYRMRCVYPNGERCYSAAFRFLKHGQFGEAFFANYSIDLLAISTVFDAFSKLTNFNVVL